MDDNIGIGMRAAQRIPSFMLRDSDPSLIQGNFAGIAGEDYLSV